MTKARKRRTPSHCLHKPKNLMYVRFGNKPHYTGRPGSSEAEAKYHRLIAEWHASDGDVAVEAPGCVTSFSIADLTADYMEAFESEREGSQQPEKLKYAVKELLTLFGPTLASEFRVGDLKTVRGAMKDRSLSVTTINQRVTMLKAMFRWAIEEEIVSAEKGAAIQFLGSLPSRSKGVKQPKVVTPVSDELVEAVLPHLSPTVAAMVQVHRLTGMRSGELVLVRGIDIDRSHDVWCYGPVKHKNQWRDRGRRVLIGPKAQALLAPLLAQKLPTAYLFSPKDADDWFRAERQRLRKSAEQPSQVGRRSRARKQPKKATGDHYDADSYRRAVQRACDRAGVPAWTPHQLRHAAAADIERQCGIDGAKAVLGHSSTRTTEIYVERDHKAAEEVMRSMG